MDSNSALAGIAVAAISFGLHGPLGAFALVMASAAAWGLSNVLTRKASPDNMLSWMVWVSAVPVLPLLAMSLLVEGPRADLTAFVSLDWSGVGGLVAAVLVIAGVALTAWRPAPRTVVANESVPVG